MNHDIQTTNNETFTHAESVTMARLVYKRFGRDAESATAAWRRLLGNNCSTRDFLALVNSDDLESFFDEPTIAESRIRKDDDKARAQGMKELADFLGVSEDGIEEALTKLPPAEIDMLARQWVGDGKLPNLYFVHEWNGPVQHVFTNPEVACAFARRSYTYWVVEDRQQGTYDENEPPLTAEEREEMND